MLTDTGCCNSSPLDCVRYSVMDHGGDKSAPRMQSWRNLITRNSLRPAKNYIRDTIIYFLQKGHKSKTQLNIPGTQDTTRELYLPAHRCFHVTFSPSGQNGKSSKWFLSTAGQHCRQRAASDCNAGAGTPCQVQPQRCALWRTPFTSKQQQHPVARKESETQPGIVRISFSQLFQQQSCCIYKKQTNKTKHQRRHLSFPSSSSPVTLFHEKC